MAEKKKFQGWPYLIGLDYNHPTSHFMAELLLELLNLIDKHGKGKTLFFEISQGDLTKVLEGHSNAGGVLDTINYAKSRGMRIVALDRKEFKLLEGLPKLSSVKKVIMHTLREKALREKAWAGILKNEAKKGDIVAVHISHRDGLLRYFPNFPKKNILWKQLTAKIRIGYSRYVLKRLSPEAKTAFGILREKERIKRQLKIEKRKGVNLIKRKRLP